MEYHCHRTQIKSVNEINRFPDKIVVLPYNNSETTTGVIQRRYGHRKLYTKTHRCPLGTNLILGRAVPPSLTLI